MRARQAKRVLAEIAAIRDLQRMAAEGEAARAAMEARTKLAQLERYRNDQASAEENWRRIVSSPSLSLDVLKLWSIELRQQAEAANRARSDVERAEREAQRCKSNWFLASKRSETAKDSARDAATKEVHKRDDAAIQDALDRRGYAQGVI
jgi:hypothetical protein